MKALASALLINDTLLHLSLGDNNIGNSGAIAISDALCANSVLLSLSMGGNHRITDDGASAFLGMLQINSGLSQLNLEPSTGIHPSKLGKIYDRLTRNKEASLDFNYQVLFFLPSFPFSSSSSSSSSLSHVVCVCFV